MSSLDLPREPAVLLAVAAAAVEASRLVLAGVAVPFAPLVFAVLVVLHQCSS